MKRKGTQHTPALQLVRTQPQASATTATNTPFVFRIQDPAFVTCMETGAECYRDLYQSSTQMDSGLIDLVSMVMKQARRSLLWRAGFLLGWIRAYGATPAQIPLCSEPVASVIALGSNVVLVSDPDFEKGYQTGRKAWTSPELENVASDVDLAKHLAWNFDPRPLLGNEQPAQHTCACYTWAEHIGFEIGVLASLAAQLS